MSGSITNPFRQGQVVVVPSGTLARSTNPRHRGLRVTKVTRRVTVRSASDGWVDASGFEGRGRGCVILPTVTWPGSGGYWKDVQVTSKLLAANGRAPLVMPDLAPYELADLDVLPSTDDGYTDRWRRPT
jgi:hypothetical protein